jgi:WD40 repeat protein
VAITTDGRFLASGDAQGNVKLRGAENGNVLHTLSGHRRGATSLVFSPDGDTLYCGEGAGGTRIWQVSSGQLQQALPSADARAEGFSGDRLMHSLSLSADGDTLATCASSVNNEFTDPVRLWSTPNARFSRSYASENIHGRPMALSPDATLIATGGKTVKLWDAHTGAMVRELFGILKRTQSIVFTADGRSIVSGGSYGTTNVWDVASGELQFTLFAFRNRESGSDEWLMYCPDHTFRGSNGVEKYLAWREKNDLVPLVENVGK